MASPSGVGVKEQAYLAVLHEDPERWTPWTRPFSSLREEFERREPYIPVLLRPFDEHRIRLLALRPSNVEAAEPREFANVVGAVLDGEVRSWTTQQALLALCAKIRRAEKPSYRKVGFFLVVLARTETAKDAEYIEYELFLHEQVPQALQCKRVKPEPVDHDDETFVRSVLHLNWQMALNSRMGE